MKAGYLQKTRAIKKEMESIGGVPTLELTALNSLQKHRNPPSIISVIPFGLHWIPAQESPSTEEHVQTVHTVSSSENHSQAAKPCLSRLARAPLRSAPTVEASFKLSSCFFSRADKQKTKKRNKKKPKIRPQPSLRTPNPTFGYF